MQLGFRDRSILHLIRALNGAARLVAFSWLPMNRCITLETKEEGGAVLEMDVKEMRGMINTLQISVTEMETKQNGVLDVLNSLDQKLGPNTSSS